MSVFRQADGVVLALRASAALPKAIYPYNAPGRLKKVVRLVFLLLGSSAALGSAQVAAAEGIVYKYDARGRVTQVARSGAVNNGTQACYYYDKGDNRKRVVVANANCPLNVRLAISNAVASEGSTVSLTVRRFGSSGSSSVAVSYATVIGTATSGVDFTPASGTIYFGAKEYVKTISITTAQDTTAENNETFFINLSNPLGPGAEIAVAQGTGTISDDDGGSMPTFYVRDAYGYEGASYMLVNIEKFGTHSSPVSVRVTTANGTATAGSDYSAFGPSPVSFLPGETVKSVGVPLLNDAQVEGPENMLINLSSPSTGTTIGDYQAVGVIYDDDG